MPESLLDYWRAHPDDAKTAAVLIETLIKALDEAEEVIATYADPGFYHAVGFWFDPPCGGFDDDFSEDYGDDFYNRPMPGKLARSFLRGDLTTQRKET